MADNNPWAKEADKYDDGNKEYDDIKDLKFKDDDKRKIRIIPSKKKGAAPFYGYKIRWIPQANSNKGKPIVENIDSWTFLDDEVKDLWSEVNRLKEEEEMTDKSPEVERLMKRINSIRAKKNYDMNVLDREDLTEKDEEGNTVIIPKRMCANQSVWKPIFEYAKKWGSPSNEENGYDLEIITEGAGKKRKYSVIPDRDSSPLTKEELKAIERGYDLAKLRKPSSLEDVEEILENAKSPIDELVSKLKDSSDYEPKKRSSKKDKKEEEQEEKKESKKEEPKEEKEEEQEENSDENSEEEISKEDSSDEDEEDLQEYECKGQFDGEDTGCKECPVQDDCKKYQPYFNEAKELKLDINPDRPLEEIVEEIKEKRKEKEEASESESKPKKQGKKGKKKLPF